MVREHRAALETIIQLGFDRFLMSGGERSVSEGIFRLKDLVIQVCEN